MLEPTKCTAEVHGDYEGHRPLVFARTPLRVEKFSLGIRCRRRRIQPKVQLS